MTDQRFQYNERVVGAGHPTLADTINRLALAEHNSDGTHKFGKLFAAQHVAATLTGTTNEATLFSTVIPGGTIGANGTLIVQPLWSLNLNANSKTVRVKLGSRTVFNVDLASVVYFRTNIQVSNRNAQNSQIYCPISTSIAFGAASAQLWDVSSVDTSVDQTLAITGQLANAADTVALQDVFVQIWRP